MKNKPLPVRILVVEDDPNDQALLLLQLKKIQMADNVMIVPNAFQALHFIEDTRSSSQWGLVAMFLDLHLPRMSGVELLHRIRKMPEMETFPVIVMTSSNNPQDLEECKKLKVMSYVQKPVTFHSFAWAIANISRQMKESQPGHAFAESAPRTTQSASPFFRARHMRALEAPNFLHSPA